MESEESLAQEALEAGAYGDAVRILRPLAERNSEYALLCLGAIYEKGLISAPDKRAARACYEQAAAQGSAAAYCDLGVLLSGEGEEAQARTAFEAGAKQGHAPSMSRLGWMMVKGRGGPKDPDIGAAWLERAAASGHTFARIHLLAIEEDNAKSIFEKLSIRLKRMPLAIRWLREHSKRPHQSRGRKIPLI